MNMTGLQTGGPDVDVLKDRVKHLEARYEQVGQIPKANLAEFDRRFLA